VTVTALAVVAAVLLGANALAAYLVRASRPPLDLAALRSADPFDLGSAVVTAALLTLVGLGVTSPARVLLALAFVTFVPGWVLLGLLPPLRRVSLTDPAAAVSLPGGIRVDVVERAPLVEGLPRIAMAVALSLTICTIASQTVLWLHLWRPSFVLGALGVLSLLALVVRFARPPAPRLLWETR